jgi:hypothetical protein
MPNRTTSLKTRPVSVVLDEMRESAGEDEKILRLVEELSGIVGTCECGTNFIKLKHVHRYCSKTCSARDRQRRHRKAHEYRVMSVQV